MSRSDVEQTILVTGGDGYIGSHTVYDLIDRGEDVVVIDSLSAGRRASVNETAKFAEDEIADQELRASVICENKIDAALHFPASSWLRGPAPAGG